jgi:hypothetical protein
MKAEGHRQAAEKIEKGIVKLQPETDPEIARMAIEGAWGASFQWIAFGCETKYQQHQNNHTRLGHFLRTLREGTVALWWEVLMYRGRKLGMVKSRIQQMCKKL